MFENLVEDARQAADPGGDRNAELLAMHMSERVQALDAFLPHAVVKLAMPSGSILER